ncbi:Patatin-like phospholipase [Lacunisphaera limnophila]|uniref:Patatin-like phospholipase n=1 Tax=Lacunisphaera limnophila TaxID=1838286 RepID=A0A1I7PHU7_9BACT|nr:patatin-like phospholipase family protein [Lacunisphaera limnophila]AOS43192.1 Patatin-like phospholipase [Lacunisphaera limnophila]
MKTLSLLRILTLAAAGPLVLLPIGCNTIPKTERALGTFPVKMEQAEQELIGSPEWGLALSGGGIRSSLFAIGGLKALHDSGRLKDVKIISSVSGGSYAAYWLYSNNQAQLEESKTKEFGWFSLDDQNFNVRVAELSLTSNFVTNAQYVGALAQGAVTFSPGAAAVNLYDQRLKRTYGARDIKDASITDLHSAVADGQSPYLVVNATVTKPKAQLGWADGLLEMTPLFVGNQQFGYRPWVNEPIQFRRAVAISGSAVTAFLQQPITMPDGKAPAEVTGTDGGKSENLGAIALIRRGVPNIIIFDAEFDPKYRYGAYQNLKNRLAEWNLALSNRELDAYIEGQFSNEAARAVLKQAVHKVDVMTKGTQNKISTIYYVKMALSDDIVTKLRASEGDTEARQYLEDFRGALSNGQQPEVWRKPWTWNQPDWKPERVAAVPAPPLDRWLAAVTWDYSGFLNSPNAPSGFIARRFKFPMYGTEDQSFYGDQAIAYIGLGYLAASEIMK